MLHGVTQARLGVTHSVSRGQSPCVGLLGPSQGFQVCLRPSLFEHELERDELCMLPARPGHGVMIAPRQFAAGWGSLARGTWRGNRGDLCPYVSHECTLDGPWGIWGTTAQSQRVTYRPISHTSCSPPLFTDER